MVGEVKPADLRKVMRLLKTDGALTIRDIDDDVLVEKEHAWASRKPSKRALQLAFYEGRVTISERNGMLKTYELMDAAFRLGHAAEAAPPRAKSPTYLLDRALARARPRQPQFDLPSRRAEQGRGPATDRGAEFAAANWCRSRSKAPASRSTGRCRRRWRPPARRLRISCTSSRRSIR